MENERRKELANAIKLLSDKDRMELFLNDFAVDIIKMLQSLPSHPKSIYECEMERILYNKFNNFNFTSY